MNIVENYSYSFFVLSILTDIRGNVATFLSRQTHGSTEFSQEKAHTNNLVCRKYTEKKMLSKKKEKSVSAFKIHIKT